MTQGARPGSPDRIRPALKRAQAGVSRPDSREMWKGMGEAWTALSTLISGIAVWGGIGYVIDRFAGTRPVLFVIGVIVGNFLGIYLVYLKYFRQDAPSVPPYRLDPLREVPPDAP
jgi:ATP synthase protein I